MNDSLGITSMTFRNVDYIANWLSKPYLPNSIMNVEDN